MVELGKPIVHFEIPVTDLERMRNFYADLFDWKFSKAPMPDMEYWMIETTGSGPGHLGGGMYPKMDANERPRLYVGVEDIDSHTERFKQAGGNVVVEKQEVPGMGWSVIGTDPEGNMIALWQAAPGMQQQQRSRSSSSRSSGRKSGSSRSKKKSSRSSKKSRK